MGSQVLYNPSGPITLEFWSCHDFDSEVETLYLYVRLIYVNLSRHAYIQAHL